MTCSRRSNRSLFEESVF